MDNYDLHYKMHWAADRGFNTIIELLVNHGVCPYPALHPALKHNNLRLLQYLMDVYPHNHVLDMHTLKCALYYRSIEAFLIILKSTCSSPYYETYTKDWFMNNCLIRKDFKELKIPKLDNRIIYRNDVFALVRANRGTERFNSIIECQHDEEYEEYWIMDDLIISADLRKLRLDGHSANQITIFDERLLTRINFNIIVELLNFFNMNVCEHVMDTLGYHYVDPDFYLFLTDNLFGTDFVHVGNKTYLYKHSDLEIK